MLSWLHVSGRGCSRSLGLGQAIARLPLYAHKNAPLEVPRIEPQPYRCRFLNILFQNIIGKSSINKFKLPSF